LHYLATKVCVVILSEAKDLLFRRKKQVLRFDQDDNMEFVPAAERASFTVCCA
jgi:hypothetical protein